MTQISQLNGGLVQVGDNIIAIAHIVSFTKNKDTVIELVVHDRTYMVDFGSQMLCEEAMMYLANLFK